MGDIKTPVKYATADLRAMLADVEETMTENFIKTEIPKEFQAAYTRRLGEGKDDTIEGKILSIAEYFMGLNQLELINRAPGFFKYQPHNVAAHSWKVAQIAQFLADVEEQNGATINWQSVYEKALNHDYTCTLRTQESHGLSWL
ncbi:hypothetical protein GQS40_03125|uniref:HD domain-containing protein n=1 Tax=Leuconostoc lactis TaxID=1246 RepID=A0A6L7A563_LEULA|nr:hypothetical protein [Leuconostoc lactis]